MVEQKIYEEKPYWENVFKVKLDMYMLMLNMIRIKLSLDWIFIQNMYILFKCSKTKKGVEISARVFNIALIQKAAVKIYIEKDETETINSRVEFSLMTGSI